MLGLTIAVLIFVWAIYGSHVLNLHEAMSKLLSKWFKEPGKRVTIGIWIVSLGIALKTWFSEPGSLAEKFKGEILSIVITTTIIDMLISYRSLLEQKERIIRQISSPVRDIAVEALRLAVELEFFDEVKKRANFKGAKFERADLRWMHFEGMDFTNADLKEAEMYGAYFEGAELWEAKLNRANLQDARFQEASLVKAIFVDAHLEEANLEGAVLRYADFESARLWAAHLEMADLRGAKLERADLRGARLTGAKYNKDTTWPTGFDPKAVGALFVD